MKKTALAIIFSVLILTSVGIRSLHAQDFNFDKAYQDYIFTQSKYSESFSTYTKARDTYQKNQTLTLKEEARVKTLDMLRSRDDFLKVYLTALRIKLVEVGGLTQAEKEAQFSRLDSEVNWYKDHKEAYKDSGPLETLFSKSKEAKDHYDLDTARKIYDALFNVSLGEIVDLRLKHEEVYAGLRREIDTNVSEGKVRIDPFNRWFVDIEGVIGQLKEQEDKAKKQIIRIYTEGYTNPASVFKTSVTPFEASRDLLSTLNGFVQELLTAFNSVLSAQSQPQ